MVVIADPASCHFQFNLTGTEEIPIVVRHRHRHPVERSVNYTKEDAPAGSIAKVAIGDKEFTSFNAVMTPTA